MPFKATKHLRETIFKIFGLMTNFPTVSVNPIIRTTYSLDNHLREGKGYRQVKSMSAASVQSFNQLVVPENKKWRLRSLVFYLSTGTWTAGDVRIYDVSQSQGYQIYREAGQVLYNLQVLNHLMEEGDYIQINCDAHTSAGNGICEIWVEEEHSTQ